MSVRNIKDLTDKELLDAYEVGCSWVAQKMQVTDTQRSVDGENYDPHLFMKGLFRLESLEDELRARKIYGGAS